MSTLHLKNSQYTVWDKNSMCYSHKHIIYDKFLNTLKPFTCKRETVNIVKKAETLDSISSMWCKEYVTK